MQKNNMRALFNEMLHSLIEKILAMYQDQAHNTEHSFQRNPDKLALLESVLLLF